MGCHEPGPVLYLALEDTPRRLQSGMRKILGGQAAPRDLTPATSCPTLPQGGDEAIARWLERHPGARMVVIDVFAKVRGTTAPGLSAYDADYAAMGRAKRLTDAHGVAVVLVHHVRKIHVIPALGKRKLRDLSVEDVDKWLAAKAKHLSTWTLKLIHSVLNRSTKTP
ncbi:AAA family ATPase [Nonomuraea sp. NPDC050536]|uniref:AAA family ATPase n=1 Tax=Nonomuraea sp. NPDC050536 TaxID=3364366 RepID=UPI0037CC5FB3